MPRLLRLQRHLGRLVAITTSSDPAAVFSYNVLDVQVDSPSDQFDWTGFRPLPWPELVSPAGAGMVRVPSENATAAPAGNVVALASDDTYLYVFTDSTAGTVVAARYALVVGAVDDGADAAIATAQTGGARVSLRPAAESRFRIGGDPYAPANDVDALSAVDADGTIFEAPAQELSAISVDPTLGFTVFPTPGHAPGHGCWQVAAPTADGAELRLWSVPRDDDGWFDLTAEQPPLDPDQRLTFAATAGGAPGRIAAPPAGLCYFQQEPVGTDANVGPVSVKRSARALVCAPFVPDGAVGDPPVTLVLDLAVAVDGSLGRYGMEPGPVRCEAPTLTPASHSLVLPGGTTAASLPDLAPAAELTVECWIRPADTSVDQTVTVVTGNAGAPTLTVEEGGRVAMRYAAAGGTVEIVTDDRVLTAGVWQHVAVSLGGAMPAVHVNGATCPVSRSGTGAPIVAVSSLGSEVSLRPAGIDELRWWNTERTTAQIREWMYRTLDEEQRTSPTLAAYWSCDALTVTARGDGVVVTVPDASDHGHDLSLSGARPQQSSPPVVTPGAARRYVDANGLTSTCGLHPAVRTDVAPALLDGADGLVHLYAASPTATVVASEFDTTARRAILTLPGTGPVTVGACATGVVGNELRVEVAAATPPPRADGQLAAVVPDPRRCTLTARQAVGAPVLSETWYGLPRRADALLACLSGTAAADPTDPRIRSGALPYYDYHGWYPAVVLADAGAPGADPVALVSRRPWPGPDWAPGALPLAAVASTADGAEGRLTLSVTCAAGANSDPVRWTWPGVPADPARLADVLAGTAADYDYAAVPGDHPVWTLPSTTGPVLVVGLDPETQLALVVSADQPDGTGTAPTVTVEATLTIGDQPVHRTLTDVPVSVADFIAVVGDPDTGLGAWLAFSDGGLGGRVTEARADTPADRRATTALLQAVVTPLSQPVQPQEWTEAAVLSRLDVTTLVQSDDAGDDPGTSASLVSALLLPGPVPQPADGLAAEVADGSAAIRVPGTGGSWTAPLPDFGLDLVRAVASAPVGTGSALDVAGPVTLEAWVAPDPVPVGSPRTHLVLHTSLPSTDPAGRGQSLGLRPNQALGVTSGSGTATVVTAPGAALAERLTDPTAWTALLAVNAEAFTSVPEATLVQATRPGLTVDLVLTRDGMVVVRAGGASAQLPAGPWERWVSIALVVAAGQLVLSVDGRTAPPIAVPAASAPTALTLGHASASRSGPVLFNDLRVYGTALGAAALAAVAQCPAPDPSLVLWWPLDRDTGDQVRNAAPSGAALDGTISGPRYWAHDSRLWSVVSARDDVAVGTAGLVVPQRWTHLASTAESGMAVVLDPGAWGDCDADTSLGPAADGFTLAAWVRPDRAAAGRSQVVVSRWGANQSDQAFELALQPDGRPTVTTCWSVGDQVRNLTVTGPSSLADARVEHLAVTVSVVSLEQQIEGRVTLTQTFTQTLYVGGRPVATATFSHVSGAGGASSPAEPAQSSSTITFGRRNDAATSLAGALAGVTLWREALSAGEVTELVAQRASQQFSGPEPAARWGFADGRGALAADSVGGAPCRLTGAVRWTAMPELTRIQVLVDGAIVPTVDLARADLPGWGPAQVSVGGRLTDRGASEATYPGQVDEARFWSCLRTAEQVADAMRVPLSGTETGLQGYWQFDAGSGTGVPDATGHTTLTLGAGPATWVTSRAPVSIEGGHAVVVPGGVDLGAARTRLTPTVAEYPDLQRSATGGLVAVMKRCYGHLPFDADEESDVVLSAGVLVADLAVVHLGQTQTRPNVVGYLEGAPPLPSENLTQAYWQSAGSSEYRFYAGASRVCLTESDEVTYSYAGSRSDSLTIDSSLKAGFALDIESEAGIGLIASLSKVESKVFAAFSAAHEQGTGSERSASDARLTETATSVTMDGDWEAAPGAYRVGRRFVPANIGIAVVKSLTADLYATVSRASGALVSLQSVPDRSIPLDVNLIPFPINPDHTRAGSLDGQIGFQSDGGTSASYYQPIQAYALRRTIERTNARLEAAWASFDAGRAGQSDRTEPASVVPAPPTVGAVNSWVWTAAGGLRVERSNYATTRTETLTGSYDRTLKGGIEADGTFIFGGPGFGFAADFMAGQHLEISVSKERESSAALGLEVEVSGEAFLKGPLATDPNAYTEHDVPGKVEAYRAMTFHLPTAADHAADLFSRVIDPTWLAMSGAEAAVALREAQGETDSAWRVLHRVTHLARVAPDFGGDPVVRPAELARTPVGLEANSWLVDLVVRTLPAAPTRAAIAEAVSRVIGLATPVPEVTLADLVPWWADYLVAAEVVGSPAALVVAELRTEWVDYLAAGYASGVLPPAATPPLGVRRSARHRQLRGVRRRAVRSAPFHRR